MRLADDSTCGWVATLPAPAAVVRLVGERRADCAVVGAGFTGLAVARRLAQHQPAWRIAVLEAQRVGLGASGRNSGFLVDVAHYRPGLGVEGNRRIVRLARYGIDSLRAAVTEHRIDCAWSELGRLHGAATESGVEEQDLLADKLDAMGEPYRRLDRAGVAAITGSEFYYGAIQTPGSVLVQPAALVRGLASIGSSPSEAPSPRRASCCAPTATRRRSASCGAACFRC
jgi:glycine/D-amino acid oxidase-like deaminating enzyme